MLITTIHDQGTGSVNEDVLLVDKESATYGVFDGATSLTKYVNEEGKTGGLCAAEIAKETFAHSNASLIDTAYAANTAIREAMIAAGVNPASAAEQWRTTAAVVRLKRDSFEWLVVADSAILLIFSDNSFEPVTPIKSHDTELLLKWKQLGEQKVTNIREKLADDLVRLRESRVSAQGVLNGNKEAEPLFKSGERPLETITNILLFTDGLYPPQEDPRQPADFAQITELYLQGGLEKVLETVRSLEKTDPHCWQYPRYKPHDDIAAIAVSIT